MKTHMPGSPASSANLHTPGVEACGPLQDHSSGAGQDPEKRRRILAGARSVFLERGFDAASMGDIARVAGVSKGTLYVYFRDKEDLFASLVAGDCTATTARLFELDTEEPDVERVLHRLGMSFVSAMIREDNIAILRMVIAVGSKFPEISQRFFEAGPCTGNRRLATYLREKVDLGLLEIEDIELATAQFFALCKGNITLPMLLGSEPALGPVDIKRVVDGAVRLFMNTYAARR
ncbi:TetR/AcrR family transcriptional regulator [Xanthobacter sp. TB0139]|uniref:TetR/AcrR family transcriptional regulator n=1 Tax=Xanthobacter sp. TB0139 TaxID=3459178 RepID=UPI0040395B79